MFIEFGKLLGELGELFNELLELLSEFGELSGELLTYFSEKAHFQTITCTFPNNYPWQCNGYPDCRYIQGGEYNTQVTKQAFIEEGYGAESYGVMNSYSNQSLISRASGICGSTV